MAEKKGLFLSELQKDKTKLTQARVSAINESSELKYKRTIEDIEVGIKDLTMQQSALLDLSNQGEIAKASEFNADQFVDRDIKISLEIEKLNLVLGVAKKRYDLLFK